jgi:hypothetical protein
MTQLFLNNNNNNADLKLKQDLELIKYIQQDLAYLVNNQREPLLRIEDKLENTEHLLLQAHEDLKVANSYHKDMKVIMLGGVLGSLAMSPLSIILGVKIGMTTLLGGALVGGYGGYKAQKIT